MTRFADELRDSEGERVVVKGFGQGVITRAIDSEGYVRVHIDVEPDGVTRQVWYGDVLLVEDEGAA